MEIKVLNNDMAKKTIKLLSDTVYDYHKMHIEQWLNETSCVKCFVLCENKTIKSFALLHKCDYDPFNIHDKPYTLDFIYTFAQYRQQNFAYKLLLYIKNTNCVTAFCNNEKSVGLFKKAGYILFDDNIPKPMFITPMPMFRFP